jgi:ribosomal protein L35
MALKTNKSILSRLKLTGSGKLLRRPSHQSHFNTKDTGKTGRLKHGDLEIKKSDKKSFKQYLPYAKS